MNRSEPGGFFDFLILEILMNPLGNRRILANSSPMNPR